MLKPTTTTFALTLLSIIGASQADAQDAAAGEKVFKVQCMACHSTVAGKNGIGPSLNGVAGRAAGLAPGFHYSQANKDSGLTWDAATLDRYLQAPRQVVTGTLMSYAGLKNDAQRADLIAYLQTVR